MRKLLFVVLAALLVVSFTPIRVAAQAETGQLTGTVTDPSGAVIPNAKVTVGDYLRHTTRTVTTDDRGNYVVTNLLPGVYEVTVEARGFGKTTHRVQITAGAKVPLDVKLTVGKEVTVVEVTAEAGVYVNTENQTISQVIDTKRVTELPTVTRNPYALIATLGNIQPQVDAGLCASTNTASCRGGGFSFNGLRAASNNVLLDGAANNNEFDTSIGITVPLDAIQEFSVITNNFTAEYGRAAGGVVNAVTKSGTNDLHGTGYLFGRYSALASNTFENNATGTDKSVFTRNQFGYSVGGPVRKNKLFFFNSIEWIRVRSAANIFETVPTPDLIAAAAAATQSFFTGQTVRSNFIPIQTFTKADLIALGKNPCPRSGPGAAACAALPGTTPMFTKGQYSVPSNSGGGDPQNTYDIVGRVDWVASDKTQIYGRVSYNHESFLPGTNENSPWVGFDTASKNKNQEYLVSMIHNFSPRLTTQSKLTLNRLTNLQPLGPQPVQPTLYMSAVTATTIQGSKVAFPGYNSITPGSAIPFGGPQNFAQAYQDISYTKGKHTLRFGGNYVYIQDNRAFGAYEESVESLARTSSFSTGIGNFLNGTLAQFQSAVNPNGAFPCVSITAGVGTPASCNLTLPVGPPDFTRSNRYHEGGVYFQDSWKALPRLTLNLGVRWEYFGVQHNKNPNKDSNYYDAVGASIFRNIRNGDLATTPNSPINGLWRKDLDDFAPRLGFAWDVFGNGKTALRGGYGVGYERNFGNVTFNVIQNPPNYAVISIFPSDIGAPIPVTPNNAGPLAGSTGTKALPRTSTRNVNSNIRTAYAHLWSLTAEHEVVKNLFLAVDYSGSKGSKLYTLENQNRIGSGVVFLGDACNLAATSSGPGDPGNCNSRLRATQYSNINRRGNNGLSLYHGLNARVDIRNIANSGLNLRTNYTWAHVTDNLSTTFSESDNNANLGLLDPFNPQLDRGNADFDFRHRFVLSGTWDIPFARWTHATSSVWKRVADGWTIAPIVTVHSGNAFTLYDCTNAFAVCPRGFIAAGSTRPGKGGPSNVPDPTTPNLFKYIDTSAINFDSTFVNPLTNISDFGPYPATMLPRGYFRAPGAWNIDFGIYKTTKINERFSIQLRGEMFNMANHSNLWVILADNDISSISFVSAKKGFSPIAQAGGKPEKRDVQLALKLIF